MGNLFPAFRETKEGQTILLALDISQVTLSKIINMPKRHILRQPALNSITSFHPAKYSDLNYMGPLGRKLANADKHMKKILINNNHIPTISSAPTMCQAMD